MLINNNLSKGVKLLSPKILVGNITFIKFIFSLSISYKNIRLSILVP